MSLLVLCLLGGCADGAHARWAASQGGLVQDSPARRVAAITVRLTSGLQGPAVRTFVLASDAVAAYSYPDGSIFITRGLVDRSTDDEIAAAVAHELGHLLGDGHLRGLATLRGADGDVEARVDAAGCEALVAQGIPPDAMARMLLTVARASASHACCRDLCRRVGILQAKGYASGGAGGPPSRMIGASAK
jgi:predicted Zn-dependent protease